jgi:hypothetical protein
VLSDEVAAVFVWAMKRVDESWKAWTLQNELVTWSCGLMNV